MDSYSNSVILIGSVASSPNTLFKVINNCLLLKDWTKFSKLLTKRLFAVTLTKNYPLNFPGSSIGEY